MADEFIDCEQPEPVMALTLGRYFRRAHFLMARDAVECTVASGERLRWELEDNLISTLHRSCSFHYPKECRKVCAGFADRASDFSSEGYVEGFQCGEREFSKLQEDDCNDRTLSQERCCWIEPVNDFFDDMRPRITSILPPGTAGMFRLGELLEAVSATDP